MFLPYCVAAITTVAVFILVRRNVVAIVVTLVLLGATGMIWDAAHHGVPEAGLARQSWTIHMFTGGIILLFPAAFVTGILVRAVQIKFRKTP